MKRFMGILFILALLALVLPVLAQGNPEDSDGDGVPDDVEIQQGTDPNNPDTDGDGVPDGATQSVQADGSIVTTYADGRIAVQSDDGLETKTTYPDGRVTTEDPFEITTQYPANYSDPALAGTRVERQGEGWLITETTFYPDGRIVRDKDGARVTTYPDGHEVTENLLLGYTTTTYPANYSDPALAGVKIEEFDDRVVTSYPNGDIVTQYTDGRTSTYSAKESKTTKTWPDGRIQVEDPSGTTTQYPDDYFWDPKLSGVKLTVREDGTVTREDPNNTFVYINPDGTVQRGTDLGEPTDSDQAAFADGTTVTRNEDGTFTITGPDGRPLNCVCAVVMPPDIIGAPPVLVPPKQEPSGDVYDYYLKQVTTSSFAPWSDMTSNGITVGQRGQPLNGLWPGGESPFIHENSAWNALASAGTFTFTEDGQVSGQGLGVFSAPDRNFAIFGDDWNAAFREDGGVSVQTDSSASFGFIDGQPYRYSCSFRSHKADFGGANVAGTYDADAETLVITLVEGTATFSEPFQAEFTGPDDGQTALVVQAASDGTFEEKIISLDEAQMAFPSAFRSLTFSVEMAQPIAANRLEAEQVWGVLFDVDANTATGMRFTTETDPIFAYLGVDFMAWIRLQDDGSFETEASFVDTPDVRLPVEVALSPDRRTLTFYIPTEEFAAQAEALGLPFVPENMRWRITAITYGDELPVKDVFPEVMYNYATGELDMPIPEPERPPQVPGGTMAGYGYSTPDGGPVVIFEDNTVSGDPNIPITGWLWDFGDGTTSTEQNPQHRYQNAGTYTVTITYTFANGAAQTYTLDVEVAVGSGIPPADVPAETSETPSDTSTSEPASACTATVSGGANLRGGPGTEFAQVGGVDGGDVLQVIGVNAAGDWYKLHIEGIDSAWIAAFLITEPVCSEGFTLPVMNE